MNRKILGGAAIILLFFAAPQTTLATSGACSSHGGINCSAGASFDGKVMCNDGWTNSSVYFSDADECRSSNLSCPVILHDEATYNNLKQQNDKAIADAKARTQLQCNSSFQSAESLNEASYQDCISAIQTSVRLSGGMNLVTTNCDAEKTKRTTANQAQRNFCLTGSDDIVSKYQMLNSCLVLDKTIPATVCPVNSSLGSDNQCRCNSGYVAENGSKCVSSSTTPPPINTGCSPYDLACNITKSEAVSQPEITPIKTPAVPKPRKEEAIKPTDSVVTVATSSNVASSTVTVAAHVQKQEPKKGLFASIFKKVASFFGFFGF